MGRQSLTSCSSGYSSGCQSPYLFSHDVNTLRKELEMSLSAIRTFWSPELKRERALRKEQCKQMKILAHYISSIWKEAFTDRKSDFYSCFANSNAFLPLLNLVEVDSGLKRTLFDKALHLALHCSHMTTVCFERIISGRSPDNDLVLNLSCFEMYEPNLSPQARLYENQKIKEKVEAMRSELNKREAEVVALNARLEASESRNRDLQQHVEILKESASARDQQIMMLQSEVNDLKQRMKEKDSILDRKLQQLDRFIVEKEQHSSDLAELQDHFSIRERKIVLLNRKIENLEDQLKDREFQISVLHKKFINNSTGSTQLNSLVHNLEQSLNERDRTIERLRAQRHQTEQDLQSENERLSQSLSYTRIKLDAKEKEWHLAQEQIIEFREQNANLMSQLARRNSQITSLEEALEKLKHSDHHVDHKMPQKNAEQIYGEESFKQLNEKCEMITSELEKTKKLLSEERNKQQRTETVHQNFDDTEMKLKKELQSKNQRILEIEEAMRESWKITSERESAMAFQHKRIIEFQNQVKLMQAEMNRLRDENLEYRCKLSKLQGEKTEQTEPNENQSATDVANENTVSKNFPTDSGETRMQTSPLL